MAFRNKAHPAPSEKQDQKSISYYRPKISERQLDAYLSARETIRRIQRTSSLVLPALAALSGVSGSNRDSGRRCA